MTIVWTALIWSELVWAKLVLLMAQFQTALVQTALVCMTLVQTAIAWTTLLPLIENCFCLRFRITDNSFLGSWHSSCFLCQRYLARIQSSAIFYLGHLFTFNCIEKKEKEAENGPLKKNYFICTTSKNNCFFEWLLLLAIMFFGPKSSHGSAVAVLNILELNWDKKLEIKFLTWIEP